MKVSTPFTFIAQRVMPFLRVYRCVKCHARPAVWTWPYKRQI